MSKFCDPFLTSFLNVYLYIQWSTEYSHMDAELVFPIKLYVIPLSYQFIIQSLFIQLLRPQTLKSLLDSFSQFKFDLSEASVTSISKYMRILIPLVASKYHLPIWSHHHISHLHWVTIAFSGFPIHPWSQSLFFARPIAILSNINCIDTPQQKNAPMISQYRIKSKILI